MTNFTPKKIYSIDDEPKEDVTPVTDSNIYNNNDIEVVWDKETDQMYLTLTSYARVACISYQTLAERVKNNTDGISHNDLKLQTIQRKDDGTLEPRWLVSERLFGDWIIDDNRLLAKKIIVKGVALYLWRLAGID